LLVVDGRSCTGCRLCERNCPFGAIMVVDGVARVGENCTLCGACMNVCAAHAIRIERASASPEELAKYRGVFVWAECEDKGDRWAPRKVVYELLHQARRLAEEMDEPVAAMLLADRRPADDDSLVAHGADTVIRFRHDLLARYSTDAFATVVSAMLAAKRPSICLMGATPDGRDLAPRVAARLKLGLTADCTGLAIDDRRQLVQTRPAFGGNIMASILTPFSRPQMATVRPNVFPVGAPDATRRGTTEEFAIELRPGVVRTRLLGVEKLSGGEGGIEDAGVIVAAGLGCQSPDNLRLVRALADALGGVMAGSRAIVEAGWIPHTLQVGQSGTTVSPDLYVAVGISGAVQHLVGMSSARTIVAINTDPEAPIFKVADLGIVGDAMEVLPHLIREVKEARRAGRQPLTGERPAPRAPSAA
jgi:electron transfer flavoprotein alpha subunit/NAD-dependent dihydropyrimidine dehydrogenase PreA subunit